MLLLDGMIGRSLIDIGNMVGTSSENSKLATIIKSNPLYVNFTPSTDDAALILKYKHIYANRLVLLIGMSSKNAILIIEFAKELRETGMSIVDSALNASILRLRAILMTAFSFLLGILPLVIASGPGATARQSLGTAVFGGMLVSNLLTLFFYSTSFCASSKAQREK